MHRKCYTGCNNTPPPLFKQNVEQFKFSVNIKTFKIHPYFISLPPSLPPSCKTHQHQEDRPSFFLTTKVINALTQTCCSTEDSSTALWSLLSSLGFLLEKKVKSCSQKVRTNKKRVDRLLNNSEGACGQYYRGDPLVILLMGDC